jgi:hypothetical protein
MTSSVQRNTIPIIHETEGYYSVYCSQTQVQTACECSKNNWDLFNINVTDLEQDYICQTPSTKSVEIRHKPYPLRIKTMKNS